MNVYKYDELTKEYTGVETAHLDPLESRVQGKDVFLCPANATFIAPLVVKEGYTQVFKDGVWNYVENHRGEQYWLDTDEYGTPARTMKELGSFPANAVFIAPEKPVSLAKAEKINELKNHRDSLEVEPIEYNGKFYDYDEKSRDRIKDAQEALEGTELSIEWTTADNTDATLFYQDFKNIRRAVAMRANMLHKRYRQLRELVDTAQTVEEVEAIKWEEGGNE